MGKVINVERRSRMIIGLLALAAAAIFLATTFGSSRGVLIGQISVGILLSFLLYTESGIVSYIQSSGFKKFTFGDIAVILGVLAGTALLVFSLGLIPSVGAVLPEVVTNFTTTFARIIGVIAVVVVGIFIVTPKFD